MSRLTFTLAGRDELSRVLDGTADSADRLRLRLAGITADADGNLRNLRGELLSTDDAARRLGDRALLTRDSMSAARDAAGRLGESLRANLISLAPAAIPATAGLAASAATLAAQFGAATLAAVAYGVAIGPQISMIGEAVQAQDAYEDAVRTSGAASAEAVKAQAVYQQQLAKMPPATREAAVAVGMLRDNYQEWSDSLADDVMGPFNKGVAVTNALLPHTTGLVRVSSSQFDRLITMVGGGISTPGFDRLTGKVTAFSERTMRRAIDSLTMFLMRAEQGEVGGGMQEFFDYAQSVGPAVWDTLQNVGDALLHVLDGASGVGAGMLDVINFLSGIVSAVPPEAIAVILQLAVAIRAVKLAAAGADVARAAMAALAVQIGAMRTAAAGAPGPLAAAGAAINSLSRTAKLAIAGTGIGLLVLAITELAQVGETAPPEVDKLTTSLGELGRSGQNSGYAAELFGKNFGKLREQIDRVIDPDVIDGFNNWGSELTDGFLAPSDSMDEFTKNVGAIDDSLANLVSGGKAELAAAALESMTKGMSPEQLKKFNGELDGYREALKAQRFEQELAAQSMGLFGEQAQRTQAKLAEEKAAADGLRQSIAALNDVHRSGLSGMIGFEAAVDAATKAAKENAGVLDMQGGRLVLNTEKQRAAATSLNDLAAKTDEAAAAVRESGGSWAEASAVYERGRQQLIKNAMQMGLNRGQARALANQILKTPDKTAMLKGDLRDLKAKLADAKERLRRAPSSKTAKIKGEIRDLQEKIRQAQGAINGVHGKTVSITVKIQRAADELWGKVQHGLGRAQGGPIRRAQGGPIPGAEGGGLLRGPGTPTSDSILLWGSTGEYMIRAASVAKYGIKFMEQINKGELPARQPVLRAGLPAAAPPPAPVDAGDRHPRVTYNVYPRKSVISTADLLLVQRQEEARQRVGRAR